jgi:hypothetical protein
MLLLKFASAFRDILADSAAPLVILSALRPDSQNTANLQRANDLAVAATTSGFGVTVLEGRYDGGTTREFFVVVAGNETQVVGFARRVIRDSDTVADWFLFRRQDGELVREDGNRSREMCVVTDDGFTLADGRIFQFGTSYLPAQFNTAWGHSLGADIGEFLRAV